MTSSQVFSRGVQIGANPITYSYFTNGGQLTAENPSSTPGNVDVFISKADDKLKFRSLVPGANISIIEGSPTSNDILISASGSGPSTALANVGLGADVFKGVNAGISEIRSITTDSSGINVSQQSDELLFSNTIDGLNLGSGNNIFTTKTNNFLNFKTLTAGSNISLTPSANDITISSPTPPPSTILANVGVGAEIFQGVNAGISEIRSLGTDSSGITVSQQTNNLLLSNTMDGSNLGSGSNVFVDKINNLLYFKSLIAGSNISLSSTTDEITISSTQIAPPITSLANEGGGAEIFDSVVSGQAGFRTLFGSNTGITITQQTTHLDIINSLTAANLGIGAALFESKSTNFLNFRSIQAGANISLTTSPTTITIAATPTTVISPWIYSSDNLVTTFAPNPAFPGTTPSNIVFPFPSVSTEGPGGRFLYDITKFATRSGYVSGPQWNNASRGYISTAFGYNNVASANYTGVLSGSNNTAGGDSSGVLCGQSGIASGNSSAIICGGNNLVSGVRSAILCGSDNTVTSATSSIVAGSSLINAESNTCLTQNLRIQNLLTFSGNQFFPSAGGSTQIANTTSHMYIRSSQMGAGFINLSLPTGPRTGQQLTIRDLDTPFGTGFAISISSTSPNISPVGGSGDLVSSTIFPLGGQSTFIYQVCPAMGTTPTQSIWIQQSVNAPKPSLSMIPIFSFGTGVATIYTTSVPFNRHLMLEAEISLAESLGLGSWIGTISMQALNLSGIVNTTTMNSQRSSLGNVNANMITVSFIPGVYPTVELQLVSSYSGVLNGLMTLTPKYT